MDTITSLLIERFQASADKPAIHYKVDGKFQSKTWAELREEVHRYVANFLARGISKGDAVALYSENRYEWILVDLALHLIGAIHVPIHSTLSPQQALDQANRSYSKLLLCSTNEKLDAVKQVGPTTAECLLIETFDDRSTSSEAGAEVESAAVEKVQPDDVATILFTSGTTGEPKGVMLTQRNLATNAVSTSACIEQFAEDVRLNFLPLSHIFARTCDLYTWLVAGCEFAIAESKQTIVPDAQAINPTIMNGVPYFFGMLRSVVEKNMGPDIPKGAITGLLGGRIRLLCSGGAALPDETFNFFNDLGTPLLQGYGMTESSPVISVSGLNTVRCGASGKPIDGVEVKIADDGEILTRGPHVMKGYFEDDEATNQMIRDGWLHTGDWGHLDDDGYLFITGRKKELIVTATGKNVSPSYLEARLTDDPLIVQALVIGDDRKYLSALIVIDPAVAKVALNVDELDLDSSSLQKTIARRIETRLADCGKHEQIAKFAVLPEPFSIEQDEVTAKLSLRRDVIEKNYASEIESMYT